MQKNSEVPIDIICPALPGFGFSDKPKETGMDSPIFEQGDWHGIQGHGSFKSSQEAYDSLYIGDANTAKRLQEKSR